MNKCKCCNTDIGNNKTYCSDKCEAIFINIQKKLDKQYHFLDGIERTAKCKCGKPKVGYKYCAECAISVRKERDIEKQKKERAANRHPCAECGVNQTNTKYCTSCAQKVKRRRDKGRYRKSVIKQEKREEGKKPKRQEINPYYLRRGNISSMTRNCSITAGGV